MKSLFLTIFLLISSVVFADGQQSNAVDISRLNADQQKAIQTLATQLETRAVDSKNVLDALQAIDPDKLKSWADAGTQAGKATANFAREVGIAGNEFIGSFIGKAVFVLAFMNYGGGKLLQFFTDTVWFVLLTPVFLYTGNKIVQRFIVEVVLVKEIRYNPNPLLRLLGVNEVSVKAENRPGLHSDNNDDAMPAIGVIILALMLWCYVGLLWPEWS